MYEIGAAIIFDEDRKKKGISQTSCFDVDKLIGKGCIEIRDGGIFLTEKGRRWIGVNSDW